MEKARSGKLSPIQTISIAAMMLALATVMTCLCKYFSRIFAVPGIRFARISFGTAIIMFSSLFLGPLYGGVVGFGSDILACLLLPTGTYNFVYTLIAIAWGVLPWLLFKLFSLIKSDKAGQYILYALLVVILSLMAYGFYGTDVFDSSMKDNSAWLKPLILSVLGASSLIVVVGLFFEERYLGKACYHHALTATILELLLGVMATDGALIFYYTAIASKRPAYVTFPYIFLFLLAIAPINILINTFASTWMSRFGDDWKRRYGRKE